MKIITFCVGMFFLVCFSQPDYAQEKKEIHCKYGIPATPLAMEAVDFLQNMIQNLPIGKTEDNSVPNLDVIFEMDSSNTVLLPYYQLNVKAFYANPSPEGIIRNLSLSKDLYIALKEGDSIKASFIAHQVGNFWEMHNQIFNRSKIIAWLPQVLNKADNQEYKIFRVGGTEIFVFTVEEETVFYDSEGEKRSGDALCADLVGLIELMNSIRESVSQKSPPNKTRASGL